MPRRNIVVTGSSNGGIEALCELVARLPSDLPAAVFVVQHLAANSINFLPTMLGQKSSLTVRLAQEGDAIRTGTIYVAPADRHLLINGENVRLSAGPRENRVRPAIDPLFRSAALSHGSSVIGLILSGWLDDGTAGLLAIKQCGGVAIVQDPDTALTPEMPQSAKDYVEVDYSLPVEQIGPLIGRIAGEEVPPGPSPSDTLKREAAVVRRGAGDIAEFQEDGELVEVSCPDCGGPLRELNGELPRFRCHTGHAFTARHLTTGLKEGEEQALWVALRTMEERARMLRRLGKEQTQSGRRFAGTDFGKRADEVEVHVEQLRRLLQSL